MKISLFHGAEAYQTQFVDEEKDVTFNELGPLICKTNWSPMLFNEIEHTNKAGVKRIARHRHKDNFRGTEFMALDVDGKCTLEEAKGIYAGYRVIFATTRNHQKVKHPGEPSEQPACDRYRVLLALPRPITSKAEYEATWEEAKRKWPFIDPSCKDIARFYYASQEVVFQCDGIPFEVMQPSTQTPPPSPRQQSGHKAPVIADRGTLFPSTVEFFKHGATENWHTELVKAAMDLKEQGYTKEDAITLLTFATKNYLGYLDERDKNDIDDVYANRGGLFAKRINRDDRVPVIVPFQPPTEEELKKQIDDDEKLRLYAQSNSVPFVCDAFDGIFKLTMGLTEIGAETGHGKSTVGANIVAHVVNKTNFTKRILIITNEESTADVYNRIACILLAYDFNAFRDGVFFTEQDKQEVRALANDLTKKVTVVALKYGEHDMIVLEDVIAVLEHARQETEKYSLVVIDYLQTINTSRSDPGMASWEISKKLGFYLKAYAAQVAVPVVLFVQLKPRGDSHSPSFSERIQNDKTMGNHAHNHIEIVPDFDSSETTFVIHKQRWGKQNVKIRTRWVKTRFEKPLSTVTTIFSGMPVTMENRSGTA